jgi:hypothetical protein
MKVNLEKRCSVKKRLKMEVNRRTDNTMVKRKITQTMIYKTLHRKLLLEKYELY